MFVQQPVVSFYYPAGCYESNVLPKNYTMRFGSTDANYKESNSFEQKDFDVTGSGVWCSALVQEMQNTRRSPWDMHTLKAAIYMASSGTGEVANAIRTCTFRPREQAFTKLISVCGRWKQSQKAREVFEAMLEARGVKPNTITYTALISACSSSGDYSSAVQVFQEMEKAATRDPGCRPNEVTYSKIITACESGGFHSFAVSCYKKMLEEGIAPDRAVYCSVLHSCLEKQHWDEATSVIKAMHKNGYAANAASYCKLISYAGEGRDWEYALELFLTMQELDQKVDGHSCHALMRAFELSEKPDMANELLSSMWETGIEVDARTYLSALRVFSSTGQWEAIVQTVDVVTTTDTVLYEAKEIVLKAAKANAGTVVIKKLEDAFNNSVLENNSNSGTSE